MRVLIALRLPNTSYFLFGVRYEEKASFILSCVDIRVSQHISPLGGTGQPLLFHPLPLTKGLSMSLSVSLSCSHFGSWRCLGHSLKEHGVRRKSGSASSEALRGSLGSIGAPGTSTE